MTGTPAYSIVVVSRNDSHGGNIGKRMRLFMNGLIAQARRHQVQMELVFVEWNPLPGKPLLQDVLPKPGPDDFLRLRYIVVPPEIHARYKRAEEIPLFQMIGKNVGIRRAKGDFVIATNIDLLFSDPLMEILKAGQLDPQKFYRANRCDIPDEISEDWELDQQLKYCENNIIRRNGWDSLYKYVNRIESGIDELGPVSRWITEQVAKRHRAKQKPGSREYYLLDREACGDFTMMHRDVWQAIEGYVEMDLYSIHVDTLGLVAARAMGYTQEVFPMAACTYHIDHPTGWSSMGPIEKLKFLEERPGIGHGVMLEVAEHVLENQIPLHLNGPDWGFAGEEFEEYVF